MGIYSDESCSQLLLNLPLVSICVFSNTQKIQTEGSSFKCICFSAKTVLSVDVQNITAFIV